MHIFNLENAEELETWIFEGRALFLQKHSCCSRDTAVASGLKPEQNWRLATTQLHHSCPAAVEFACSGFASNSRAQVSQRTDLQVLHIQHDVPKLN